VVEIKNILATQYGYDRTAYSKNLERILAQMSDLLFKDLVNKPISSDLKSKISALMPLIGRAQSRADAVGDRPSAFTAAEPVATAIKDLYSAFSQLSASKDMFNTALMVEFFNERLIEYGEYDP